MNSIEALPALSGAMTLLAGVALGLAALGRWRGAVRTGGVAITILAKMALLASLSNWLDMHPWGWLLIVPIGLLLSAILMLALIIRLIGIISGQLFGNGMADAMIGGLLANAVFALFRRGRERR